MFILYLVFMLGIGIWFFMRSKDAGEKDYFLGGREMGAWVSGLSAGASDMSAWVLMGMPASIYAYGMGKAWIPVGLFIGYSLSWIFIAPRLRSFSIVCGDSITIPDFIANRFRDTTGVSRVVAALIILVFFTFYTASGFVSAAKLFSTMFPIAYTTSLWIGALVVVGYTLLGGYMAVCWTDFVQGLLMFVAIVVVPAVVVCNAGGFAATVDQLNAINGNLLNLFTSASTGKACGFIGLASCLAWGLGYFGMPHILVRFMSIDNPAEVKGSRRIAMTWVFISLGAATVLGLVFHLYLKQRGLTLADVGNDPEKCFMVMINGIFNTGVLARVFAGILLSAIMAAIMSTADSQLLVSASSFTNDLYGRVKKRASNKELVLVSRLAVAAVAIVAAALAMNTESDFFKVVMKMVSFAWAGFGASFGPLILLALFWRRVNLAGAVSGMVVGAVTCFVWKFVLAAKYAAAHPIFNLYELAPGFLLALVVTVAVSLVTKAPAREIVAEFEKVDAE